MSKTDDKCLDKKENLKQKIFKSLNLTKICLFKKLLFTMKNTTTAGSSQSNISRIYIWKDTKQYKKNVIDKVLKSAKFC